MIGGPGRAVVLLAVRNDRMRRYVRALLESECGGWDVVEPGPGETVSAALRRVPPDLLLLDSDDYPTCCHAALAAFPPDRTVIIASEHEPAYRDAALGHGAAGWLTGERVAEELDSLLHQAAGTRHSDRPGHPQLPSGNVHRSGGAIATGSGESRNRNVARVR